MLGAVAQCCLAINVYYGVRLEEFIKVAPELGDGLIGYSSTNSINSSETPAKAPAVFRTEDGCVVERRLSGHVHRQQIGLCGKASACVSGIE